jgi:hypothetical protein
MVAGDPLPDLKARVEALRSGAIPSAPPGPGSITPLTWTMLGFALVPALVGAAAELAGRSKNQGCLAGGVGVGAFFFLIFLIALIADLVSPSPRSRTTPERAAKAFYAALRRKSYRRAYACLSPLDRIDALRPIFPIGRLSVPQGSFSFDDRKGFAKYWREQSGLATGLFGGYHKTLRAKVLKVETVTDRVAAVDLRLDMSGYPPATVIAVFCGLLPALILIAVTTRQETFHFRKLVVEKDGLWWLLNGEFSDDGDEAIERLLATSR